MVYNLYIICTYWLIFLSYIYILNSLPLYCNYEQLLQWIISWILVLCWCLMRAAINRGAGTPLISLKVSFHSLYEYIYYLVYYVTCGLFITIYIWIYIFDCQTVCFYELKLTCKWNDRYTNRDNLCFTILNPRDCSRIQNRVHTRPTRND